MNKALVSCLTFPILFPRISGIDIGCASTCSSAPSISGNSHNNTGFLLEKVYRINTDGKLYR